MKYDLTALHRFGIGARVRRSALKRCNVPDYDSAILCK